MSSSRPSTLSSAPDRNTRAGRVKQEVEKVRIDGPNASAVGPGIGEVRAAEMDSSPALAAAKVKIGRHVLEAFTTANIKPPGPQDVHDSLSEAVDLTATRKLGRLPSGFIGQGHIQTGKLSVPPVKR